jgi:RNA polymerase sigma-70 factor (ECF subfamily)
MDDGRTTCWTMIRSAAAGDEAGARQFVEAYAPVVRAYLLARWNAPALRQDVDDAVQEVFVECFRERGAIARADSERPGGFRAFLFGVVRNVARRHETRRTGHDREQSADPEREVDGGDAERLSRLFDRHWARRIMREAAERQQAAAAAAGEAAQRRVDLLRMRFAEGLPIREIAALWDMEPTLVHREYARARREFRDALESVIRFHEPGSVAQVAEECTRLLGLLA